MGISNQLKPSDKTHNFYSEESQRRTEANRSFPSTALATEEVVEKIQYRWISMGKPKFREFSPYAAYCSKVLQIYFLGITGGVFSVEEKQKTLMDMNRPYVLQRQGKYLPRDLVGSNPKYSDGNEYVVKCRP